MPRVVDMAKEAETLLDESYLVKSLQNVEQAVLYNWKYST